MIFSIFLVFLFVLAIVTIIAALVIVSSRNINRDKKEVKNDGESFEKITRTIYFYLIMIIALCILLVSFIGLFNSILDLLLPENVYTNLKSIDMSKNIYIKNLITSVVSILVAIPIFLYSRKNIK